MPERAGERIAKWHDPCAIAFDEFAIEGRAVAHAVREFVRRPRVVVTGARFEPLAGFEN